jgi:FKBP-type peptidyl-prolyl cis-trans isomerase
LAGLTIMLLSGNSHAQESLKGAGGSPPTESSSNDREARKHYLVALEALKNSDLAEALSELKKAASLAPNRALIWYNIAVVESREGKVNEALDDLHKAERLGLPASQQDDVDKLEAKLTYAVKRKSRTEAVAADQSRRSQALEKLKALLDRATEVSCEKKQSSSYGGVSTDRFEYSMSYNPKVGFKGFDLYFDSMEEESREGDNVSPGVAINDDNYQTYERSYGVSLANVDPANITVGYTTAEDYCREHKMEPAGASRSTTLGFYGVTIPTKTPSEITLINSRQHIHDGKTDVNTHYTSSGTAEKLVFIFPQADDANQFADGLRELVGGRTKQLGESIASLAQLNRAAARNLLAKNGKQSDVITTPSGLQYKVLSPGRGDSPRSTDLVTVNYRGTLLDGTEFDNSFKRGQPPTFPVNRVIKGWQEALVLMKPGAKWELYIPPELAYDEKSVGPIPPGSLLKFEIELLSVNTPSADR